MPVMGEPVSEMTKTQTHTHTHTRLTALFQDYPGEPVPQKGKTNLDFVARVSVSQRLSNFIECCSVEEVYLVLNITG